MRIPRAAEAFPALTGSERYAVLHTIITAPNPATGRTASPGRSRSCEAPRLPSRSYSAL